MSKTLSALLDRLRDWRDRKLADPKFRASLLANPLTRFYARRRAKAMLDLCAGFVYSQTLFACVQLNLFEHLRAGPQSVEYYGGVPPYHETRAYVARVVHEYNRKKIAAEKQSTASHAKSISKTGAGVSTATQSR